MGALVKIYDIFLDRHQNNERKHALWKTKSANPADDDERTF